ncbi:hypothetical protein [Methyloprofundus sp.]|uniref:hypothetical protein n=1 Tax=Methyloprofundus sp. TaxID=2020875 RepID=UPI003D0B41C6
MILFAAVQFTMVFINLLSGNKLHFAEWLGLIIAFSGFVYFVLPSLTSPSLTGFILMTVAGIAWGFYTLKGRVSKATLNLETAVEQGFCGKSECARQGTASGQWP